VFTEIYRFSAELNAVRERNRELFFFLFMFLLTSPSIRGVFVSLSGFALVNFDLPFVVLQSPLFQILCPVRRCHGPLSGTPTPWPVDPSLVSFRHVPNAPFSPVRFNFMKSRDTLFFFVDGRAPLFHAFLRLLFSANSRAYVLISNIQGIPFESARLVF